MSELISPEAFSAFLQVIFIDLVLAGDNAIVVGMAAAGLLVGGGVGIPPMVFLAEWMVSQPGAPWKPLVLMGSEIPFPFKTRPSTILVPGIPAGAIAAMPLLDGWSVPSRPSVDSLQNGAQRRRPRSRT